jgi:phosphatidylglycerol lysyltransferase
VDALRIGRTDWAIRLVAVATFANGLLGVLHALIARLPEPGRLGALLPFGVHHWSKLLSLLSGFALIDLSYHLLRRRRAAWWLAVCVLVLATAAHLERGHHAALAIAPAMTAVLLFLLRHRFTVRSEPRSIVQGLGLVAAGFAVAVAYGALGFWRLDRDDFGIEFHWRDATVRSLRQYLLIGNPDLSPRTRHARWFLDSLHLLGLGTAGFALYSLYRPLEFRLRTLPHERAAFKHLLDAHGNSSLDYFKLAADKSYFFAGDGSAAVAYRAAWGVAVALGDPVGPRPAIEPVVQRFAAFCSDNGWRVAFYQTPPDYLEAYRRLGFQVLKVGEEGLVDLAKFAAETAHGSTFRRVRKRAASLGVHVTRHELPLTSDVLEEVHAISNEWLRLPGRRERGFTVGRFVRGEIEQTPLLVARDAAGRGLAFVNVIPCWPAGDATIDLMRHQVEIPNITMDFLFLETLTALAGSHRRFSLGLAPLAGVGDRPGASLEERAVHQMYERLNRFFSYKGLRSYKAKFEPVWEERFLVYQGGAAGLANAGIALTRVTEG